MDGQAVMTDRDTGLRTMPGTTAPNLPVEWKPYIYRGSGVDELTPRMKGGPRSKPKPQPVPEPEPELEPTTAQDEARLQELEEHLAVRGVVEPVRQPIAESEPEGAPAPAVRHRACGYLKTAPGHRLTCGSGS